MKIALYSPVRFRWLDYSSDEVAMQREKDEIFYQITDSGTLIVRYKGLVFTNGDPACRYVAIRPNGIGFLRNLPDELLPYEGVVRVRP